MTDIELIQAIRSLSVETGSLMCLGCGHEHKCGIHGCTIMRSAADRIEQISTEQPNDPLTVEELRRMDGEPVWCEDVTVDAGIVRIAEDWVTEQMEAHFWTFNADGNPRCYNVRLMLEMGAEFYRRKPDGGRATNGCNNCAKRRDIQKETNAERIRGMSDEELAEFLAAHCGVSLQFMRGWLQQPAAEEVDNDTDGH